MLPALPTPRAVATSGKRSWSQMTVARSFHEGDGGGHNGEHKGVGLYDNDIVTLRIERQPEACRQ